MAKAKTPPSTATAPYGRGGSYTTDPVTGLRTLIKPATAPSAPCCVNSPKAPEPVVIDEPDASMGDPDSGDFNG